MHLIALEKINLSISEDQNQSVIHLDEKIKPLSDVHGFSSHCFFTEEFFNALINYQSNQLSQAELGLRDLIKRYPMCREPRAGLTALLWRKGFIGEAKSNWAAAEGLERSFNYSEWIIPSQEWPQKPAEDLANFLEFIK